MKIGYYVQGAADEAVVWGLCDRWCPQAELAEAKFRGSSGESFRRELPKALRDLRDAKECDVLVVLTDSDVNDWRDVQKRETDRIPLDCRHLCVFGVAVRNIECWLVLDRHALADELGCDANDLAVDDPSHVVKRRFGLGERDFDRDQGKQRVRRYVANANLKAWINNGASFADFYDEARRLATQTGCAIPNERESTQPRA